MIKKERKHALILGIKVDVTSREKVLRNISLRLSKLENSSSSAKKFFIVTPNPEQVILAQKDRVFAKILNSADVSLTDGIGLVMADKFLKLPKTRNIFLAPILYFVQGLGIGFSALFDTVWLTKDIKQLKGREIFLELIKLADKKEWRVYLLGGWERVAERTKLNLEKNFKKVNIKAGTGPLLDNDGNPINKSEKDIEAKIIKTINEFNPHILFVGFRTGAQEKWLYRWLERLNIGGAMVVGGTFNYISGQAKLPPSLISELGLEWLWRLITGSQKAKRIGTALFEFPLKIFWQKLAISFFPENPPR